MLELSERIKDFLDMSRKESRTFQPLRDFAKAMIVRYLHRLIDLISNLVTSKLLFMLIVPYAGSIL
jgi:hypothetical protein